MTRSLSHSLAVWQTHFRNNRPGSEIIPWEAEEALSGEEIQGIEKSIAAFQLGEYSEGKGLLKFAEAYSARFGGSLLFEITQLFIKEEQHHAALLKRFMLSHDIKLLKRHWTDTVFRRLRKLFDYELSITVLITAEIISLVYYKALKGCTSSEILRRICDKILADEIAHVRYESEVILFIRGSKPNVIRHVTTLLHRFLFCGTVLVVYFDHRRVFKQGGYGLPRYWKACWLEFSNCFTRREAAYRSLEESITDAGN